MVQGRKPNLERRRRIHPFTKPDTQKIGRRVHDCGPSAAASGCPQPPSIPLSTFLPQTGRVDRKKKSPGARRTPPITAFSATSSALTGARARTGAHGAWRREIAAKPCEKGRYNATPAVRTPDVVNNQRVTYFAPESIGSPNERYEIRLAGLQP